MTKEAGRPTSYNDGMLPIIDKILSEGGSLVKVCVNIGITFETMTKWRNPESRYYNKTFSDAVKGGLLKSQVWWEDVGQQGMFSGDKMVSAPMWTFNVKNRFKEHWSDTNKQEITGANGAPIATTSMTQEEARKVADSMDSDLDGDD